MLITFKAANLILSNTYSIDSKVVYTDSLVINTINTKKGIANDIAKISISKAILDTLNSSFLYLCYDTPCQLYLDNILVIDGYISKISLNIDDTISFDLASILTWQLKQFVSPSITTSCQNQVYSTNCSILANDFSFFFNDVEINCFDGSLTLDINAVDNLITLGGSSSEYRDNFDGNHSLFDGNLSKVIGLLTSNSLKFFDRNFWWNAYVIINNEYKTTIVNVTETKIFLALNYTLDTFIAKKIQVVLKCDKTYGQCYSRFDNTQNFWGFPNTGSNIATYDIFSATELNFCGIDLVNQSFEPCSIDNTVFGVNLDG